MGVNSQPTASSVIDPNDWVEYAAREHPRRLFLRTPAARQLSYEALREKSASLASALQGRGVACGDRVAARVEKSLEAVLLYVACLRMGAVVVPIDRAHRHCAPGRARRARTARPSRRDPVPRDARGGRGGLAVGAHTAR